MATSILPVFYKTQEIDGYTANLPAEMKSSVGKDADLLLNHPAIYVHVWRSKYDILNGTYSIYVGETNDIVERTNEHWYAAKIPKEKRKSGNWQYHMAEDVDENGKKVIPTVYFFGHKLFHKSLTLDIENRLIDYCYAMPTAHTYNGRTNPQGCYSGDDNLDDIFAMIWKVLRSDNPDLFLSQSAIQKSAIYKASPNHKLTEDQKKAKTTIISRTMDAVLNQKQGQLIFVEGEAGTGKTVLTSSTYFEFLDNEFIRDLNLKCFFLINHAEQQKVYQNMARKLGYSDDIIQSPTDFLKKHSVKNVLTDKYEPSTDSLADIVFVDEAHLLWSTHTQAFDGHFSSQYQLTEIIKRSRVTVIMFDENQVLHFRQVYEYDYMNQMRQLAMQQGEAPEQGKSNYILLNNQLRMNCSSETVQWIDSISKNLCISELSLSKQSKDKKGYEILIFDDPASMHQAIKSKAAHEATQLSRVVAMLDWKYSDTKAPTKHYWDITIGEWSIPWNEEIFWRDLYWNLNKREIKRYKALDWVEKDYSINEAGNTFTVQGFDLSYVGVILGPSVQYDPSTNTIFFDEAFRSQNYMVGKRKMPDGTVIPVASLIAQHEMRVLLTRGTKGLFIYACDDNLRKALKDSLHLKP